MAPYRSRAQQGLFHYLESKGKMPKKTVDEFDQSTDYGHLPEHKAFGGEIEAPSYGDEDEDIPDDDSMPEHFAEGGMVGENYDYEMGRASEYDSAGEPHTEDEKEDEHPMEFMARGGRVRKMAMGGMMRPAFAKALRKARY